MTILEVLSRANIQLKEAEIDSPMLDAQVILAHILHERKSWLFSHFEEKMSPEQEDLFFQAIERRKKHEPVAYIIESKPFYGRNFYVNHHVLIPRPATETLIEKALEIIKAFPADTTLVCDIGTGSGAIAITLALEAHIPVIATDLHAEALDIAKKNALDLSATDVEFRLGNLLEPLIQLFTSITASHTSTQTKHPFTHLLVCANLPYLSLAQMQTLDPDVQHEPASALAAGADGLDAYHAFFRQLKKHREIFPKHVSILIEIDPAQTEKAVNLMTHNFPMSQPRVIKDLQGLDRVLLVQM